MSRRTLCRFVATTSSAVLLMFAAARAQAQLPFPSPAGCSQNRFIVDIGTPADELGGIVSGQPIVYAVSYGNNPIGLSDACDVTGALVVLICPNAAGLPDPTTGSQVIVLATQQDFLAHPSGSSGPGTVVGIPTPVSETCNAVTFNAGVTQAVAQIQAGDNTLADGTVHFIIAQPLNIQKPVGLPVNTCIPQVDKEVSCDGGQTFHDVGFVVTPDGVSDFCASWNAHDQVAAEAVIVRYIAKNAGTGDVFNCTLTDNNAGLGTGTLSFGTIAHNTTATPKDVTNLCSDQLAANEPDLATLTCDCTMTAGEVQQSASDDATFLCQTPGLTVTKDCALQDKNGNSAVRITVTNTGTAALANCKVTDTNLTGGGCATPPGLPVGGSSVAVSPSMFDPGVGAAAVTAIGTITGLTQNSCNTVSVTCDIVGSVDPNNPGHPKTLSASAQDTCETCSVKVDKQIKCGAGPFVDGGFVTNNEDGTASCLGWNAFTVNGTSVAAEALTVQYVAQNTGGTGLFGCTVTDSNTAISSTAVSIGNVAQGGTSNPVPINSTCSDTLDAQEPDTATLSCFCTADLDPNFVTTAKDTASFDCQTPGLTVTKDCALRDTNGDSTVAITVKNTGTAELANCVVTDTNFTDAGCPASGNPSGASSAVAVTPSTIASLGAGATAPSVTGTIAGLTQNSCNTTAVTW